MFLNYAIKVIIVLAYIYGCIWLFNHINAWLGIGAFVGLLIYLGNQLFNKIKNS